jgi:hypothetical protein
MLEMSIKHGLLQLVALFSVWKFTQADSPLISAGREIASQQIRHVHFYSLMLFAPQGLARKISSTMKTMGHISALTGAKCSKVSSAMLSSRLLYFIWSHFSLYVLYL